MRINHVHLACWLAENTLSPNLLFFRKIFQTRQFSIHCGQSEQDLFLGSLFPRRYKEFVFDVKGFHPVKYKNTYALNKTGWRGVNIDIHPIKIKGFNCIRPGDTTISMTASLRESEVTFWSNGLYPSTVTMEKSFADEHSGMKYQYRPQNVQAQPLRRIPDVPRFAGRHIDLLYIDSEGYALQMVKELDFERNRPGVIAVEFEPSDLDYFLEIDLHLFPTQKKDNLINRAGLIQIYRDKSQTTRKEAN